MLTSALITPGDTRHTAADEVFAMLHADILSLHLPPGTKLSEADVSRRLGVSRQPVREAFIRLANMNMLWIRPQRATMVRQISMADITRARFVRIAIEVEVVQRACLADKVDLAILRANLAHQDQAVEAGDLDWFHTLDEQFHRQLCVAAGCVLAHDTIVEAKAHVDRLCVMSLRSPQERAALVADHHAIVDCLERKDSEAAVRHIRCHLSRLDQVIAEARKKHPEYFDE